MNLRRQVDSLYIFSTSCTESGDNLSDLASQLSSGDEDKRRRAPCGGRIRSPFENRLQYGEDIGRSFARTGLCTSCLT